MNASLNCTTDSIHSSLVHWERISTQDVPVHAFTRRGFLFMNCTDQVRVIANHGSKFGEAAAECLFMMCIARTRARKAATGKYFRRPKPALGVHVAAHHFQAVELGLFFEQNLFEWLSPAERMGRDNHSALPVNFLAKIPDMHPARNHGWIFYSVSQKMTFLAGDFHSAQYDQAGNGVAKLLMDAVMTHPDLGRVRNFMLATRDAHGLYAKYGFAPIAEPGRWMAIRRPYR